VRVRITFAKTEAMRFTSHLDLQRTWERTLRRAGLPLAYSQGFTPRPRIQLAAALPLGFTSQGEVMDIWLEETLPLPSIEAALQTALPPGLRLLDIQETALNLPPLQTQLHSSEYLLTLAEPDANLEARLAPLLAADTLPRERRGKPYDLRPLIEDLRLLSSNESGQPRLHLRLTAREGSTGRPEAVLESLGINPETTQICRMRLNMENSCQDY